MNDILKFLGQYPSILYAIGILIAILFIFVIAIYIVAFSQGRDISFWPPKIGKGENQRRSHSQQDTRDKLTFDNTSSLTSTIKLNRTDILIEANAQNDCKILEISSDTIINFILSEASHHPALFVSPFSSIPIVFTSNIILLTWDTSLASVERVLNRTDAYPTSDSWYLCVSLYRQATTLPYRTRQTKPIIIEQEARHTINLYRKLLRNINNFITLNNGTTIQSGFDVSVFESLLDEAEFALFRENTNVAIVKLEALLSSIHKFLISNAPQVVSKASPKLDNTISPTPKLTGGSGKSILLVEDNSILLEVLFGFLKEHKELEDCRISCANNGDEALKAMVEHDYDLVVTDVQMPILDGREVAIGTKMISPKTKILFLTVLPEFDQEAKRMECDILFKPVKLKELVERIHKLLD